MMETLYIAFIALTSLVFLGSFLWKLLNQSWRPYKTFSTFSLLISTIILIGLSSSSGSQSPNNELLFNPRLRQVGSRQTMEQLIQTNQNFDGPNVWMNGPETDNNTTATPRDVIGTNNQVVGIEEGDIVKTDRLGQRIFYASYYSNHIYVLEVSLFTNVVQLATTIDLGNTYAQSLFVTEDYLIVIGYRYDFITFGDGRCGDTDDQDIVTDCFEAIGYQETSTIVFIDLTTLTVVYTVETDFAFMDYRLIDNSLFLVGNRLVYASMESMQPTFKTTLENSSDTQTVSYDRMYYFENSPVYSMTVLVGLKIDADPTLITFESDAYLGSHLNFKSMYVSYNAMYLSQSFYHYENNRSYSTMTISQFDLNIPEATLTYRASTEVRGQGLNQFSMDEYNGYLRLATTEIETTYVEMGMDDMAWEWNQTITNYLYVLRVNNEETFDLIGIIDENLGKPNESIRSVRFEGDQAFVVTFLNTDPLYIIDVSNPADPTILDDIELPGFDTYQHVWGENQLVGLGFSATEEGQITGMKLTAYDTTIGSAQELQTYEFTSTNQEEIGEFTYYYSFSYGEALYNHKALMISPEHGLLGLGVTSWVYGIRSNSLTENNESDESSHEEGDYYFGYRSYYAIFKIDFNAAEVIADPIMIEHPESQEYHVTVDRGVYIDGVVHTLSNQQVISYDLNRDEIIQRLQLYSPTERL